MCKYCDNLLKNTNVATGPIHKDAYLHRINDNEIYLVFCDFETPSIQVNNCPWCGNNLNWLTQDDDDGMLLVVGSINHDSVFDADYVIGAFTSVDSFVEYAKNDFDLLHGHENMWYYVIKPNVVAKYHHIVKFERCDE